MYPVLKIPTEIELFLQGSNPYEKDNVYKPTEPKFDNRFKSWLIASFLFLTIAIFIISNHLIAGLFFIVLTVLTSGVYIQELKEEKKKYNKQLEYYEFKLKNYDKYIKERQRLLELKNDSSKYLAYLRQEVKNYAKKATPFQTNEFPYKKGNSENIFWNKANLIFGGEIFRNVTIPNQDWLISYMPDFVFFNTEITIDIEIDEPYTYNDKKPIHYFDKTVSSHIDSNRDDYFTTQNWFVIRFTENQILSNINGCLYYVADVIRRITDNSSYLEKLIDTKPVVQENFWTLEEVHKMVESDFRNLHIERHIL
jgi:very-short-patch-repair endonuclease/uncharacterized membrane protein